MVNEVMKFLTEQDPEIGKAVEKECARQRRNLELIASENIVSEAVMKWKPLLLSVRKSCLAAIMPMCSHIPERRRIWQYLWQC